MLGSSHERSFGARAHADLTEWATTRTGLAIPQIALQFESLGENCEFGLFQRRCDAEPLGLLRFSSTFMRNLIRGIDNGFEGLGEIEDIDPRLEGAPRKEYMIHERKFGLVYHTFVYEGQRSVWLMREQESARLKFLRRKFMEELESPDKIFVYKFGAGVSEEEILPLHMALNRYGEATLLWVVPAERDRPARHGGGRDARPAERLHRPLRARTTTPTISPSMAGCGSAPTPACWPGCSDRRRMPVDRRPPPGKTTAWKAAADRPDANSRRRRRLIDSHA